MCVLCFIIIDNTLKFNNLLSIWKLHKMYLDHIYPSPNSSKSTPTNSVFSFSLSLFPIPPSFLFFLLYPIKSTLCCTRVWGLSWSVATILSVSPFKNKTKQNLTLLIKFLLLLGAFYTLVKFLDYIRLSLLPNSLQAHLPPLSAF